MREYRIITGRRFDRKNREWEKGTCNDRNQTAEWLA
jgi:hypothetical protein